MSLSLSKQKITTTTILRTSRRAWNKELNATRVNAIVWYIGCSTTCSFNRTITYLSLFYCLLHRLTTDTFPQQQRHIGTFTSGLWEKKQPRWGSFTTKTSTRTIRIENGRRCSFVLTLVRLGLRSLRFYVAGIRRGETLLSNWVKRNPSRRCATDETIDERLPLHFRGSVRT